MPYYVYAVRPFAQLTKLAEHAAFRDASVMAKSLRAEQPSGSDVRIKVMFADDELQAEDLLCQVREPGPSGDE